MKIIGDSLIPFEDFFRVLSIEDIKNTKSNSMLFFDFNEDLLKYSFSQNLNFFVLNFKIFDLNQVTPRYNLGQFPQKGLVLLFSLCFA